MWLRNLSQLSDDSDRFQSGETKREEEAGEDPATGSQGPERGAINSQGEATPCRQRDYASHACYTPTLPVTLPASDGTFVIRFRMRSSAAWPSPQCCLK